MNESHELTNWTVAPGCPKLESGEVHLWRFPLALPTAEVDNLKALLSADEKARADRLLNPTIRQSFVVARARLRQILSRYLQLPPAELRFSYGPAGKPYLDSVSSSCHFNLSHTHIWALLAVSGDSDLGVDLEFLDPKLDFFAIARRFFPPADLEMLTSAPPVLQRQQFYRLWTTHEAMAKLRGSGISSPPAHPPAQGLQVIHLSLSPDFVGTLAFGFNLKRLHCWELGTGDSD